MSVLHLFYSFLYHYQVLFSVRPPVEILLSSNLIFQVFDGAVIVLSLAPMVASTVANGPSSPWDAISLIITLRIWRIKRLIDGMSNSSCSGLMQGCHLNEAHRMCRKSLCDTYVAIDHLLQEITTGLSCIYSEGLPK